MLKNKPGPHLCSWLLSLNAAEVKCGKKRGRGVWHFPRLYGASGSGRSSVPTIPMNLKTIDRCLGWEGRFIFFLVQRASVLLRKAGIFRKLPGKGDLSFTIRLLFVNLYGKSLPSSYSPSAAGLQSFLQRVWTGVFIAPLHGADLSLAFVLAMLQRGRVTDLGTETQGTQVSCRDLYIPPISFCSADMHVLLQSRAPPGLSLRSSVLHAWVDMLPSLFPPPEAE